VGGVSNGEETGKKSRGSGVGANRCRGSREKTRGPIKVGGVVRGLLELVFLPPLLKFRVGDQAGALPEMV
jgi:hypothetical protein